MEVRVLGTAQDGGIPQMGCVCETCAAARIRPELRRLVSSIAVHDQSSGERWLLDCSPDVKEQAGGGGPFFAGIFLTHAHMGHYAGLLQLGKEAYCADKLPVYCSEQMAAFLQANEPWAALSRDERIMLRVMRPGEPVAIGSGSVEAFLVPHRAEYSDTFGFLVKGPNKRRLMYLPDVDHWNWDCHELMADCDVCLVDGTFYDGHELPGRDLSLIPHPFVSDSVRQLARHRGRIWFTHLNHSNPCASGACQLPDGFRVAADGERFQL